MLSLFSFQNLIWLSNAFQTLIIFVLVSVCIAVTRYMIFRVLNAAAQPLLTLDDLQMIIQPKEQESLILIEVNMTTMKNSIRNCNLLNSSADLD